MCTKSRHKNAKLETCRAHQRSPRRLQKYINASRVGHVHVRAHRVCSRYLADSGNGERSGYRGRSPIASPSSAARCSRRRRLASRPILTIFFFAAGAPLLVQGTKSSEPANKKKNTYIHTCISIKHTHPLSTGKRSAREYR